jgi:hypothetical protein
MRFVPLFSSRFVLSAALLCLGCTAAANADVIKINVSNGGFENLAVAGTSNQLNYHVDGGAAVQQASGWTNGNSGSVPGYNFVFSGSTASGTSYGKAYGTGGSVYLWGTQNGVSNGITSSPDGGNFLGMDGVYQSAAVSQQLTGLTPGMNTKVYFYYAGAQQYAFDGPTTEGFKVSLSDGKTTESHSTAMLSNSSHGFTGWNYTYLDFTATSTTETLSFLALGTPSGEPPFSLLDGISVVQVTPEPSSLALLGTGVLAMGGMIRRRYAKG